jgi:hypothetical protein
VSGNGHAPDRPVTPRLDADLGPVNPPPVDTARLEEPLGPPPLLPRGPDRRNGQQGRRPSGRTPGRSDPTATQPTARQQPDEPLPTRLPRRHEVEQARNAVAGAVAFDRPDLRHDGGGDPGWGHLAGPAAATRPGSALDRAREARANRLRAGDPTDPPSSGRDAARTRRPSTSQAPALPVIVLIGVVVALTVGVAYMVITGDGTADPGAGSGTTGTAPPASQPADPLAPPTDVTATEANGSVQLTWTGTAGTNYVVRILQAGVAPGELPPTSATSLTVPPGQLDATSGYCFDVAVAPDPAAGTPAGAGAGAGAAAGAAEGPDRSSPACIRGATPDAVQAA